jgi:hypothetical protein
MRDFAEISAGTQRAAAVAGALAALALTLTGPSGQVGDTPAPTLNPFQAGPTLARQAPAQSAPARAVPAAIERRIERSFAKLPVAFVPNRGQVDARARYHARGAGYGFYFTKSKAVLVLTKGERTQMLELAFGGANPHPRLVANRPTAATVNELAGHRRHSGLRSYARLTYRDLWPGIDMVFFGAQGELRYEFHLAAGADPKDIRLAYRNAKRLSLAPGGDLVLDTKLGTLTDARPRSYQHSAGERQAVRSGYALRGGGSFGFRVGSYDPTRPLVIDPGLDYATYLGGSGNDEDFGIAVDGAGSAYVVGYTASPNFSTTAGAFDTTYNGGGDVFVAKLAPSGGALTYATYLGGSGGDHGYGIAVDGSGSAYVTGQTSSANFPTTAGAFDTTYNSGTDAFVAKLAPSGGALTYATYLGGSGYDVGQGIAVDGAGGAYVAGSAGSANFPTTAGAFDTTYNEGSRDAFVAKLAPSGGALAYASYLGGGGEDGARGSPSTAPAAPTWPATPTPRTSPPRRAPSTRHTTAPTTPSWPSSSPPAGRWPMRPTWAAASSTWP